MKKISSDRLASSQFYKHIHLYHELLPHNRIDQQMMALLMGKQQCTAISEDGLIDFFTPVKLPKSRLTNDFYQSGHIMTAFMANAMSSDKNKQGLYKDDIVNRLRTIIKQKPQTHIHTNLVKLLYNQPMADNQRRLVQWVIMLYEYKNKPAIIQRYLSEIAQVFLSLTHETDFIGWSTEDYDGLYENLIAIKNPAKPGYTRTVIKSLHDCLMRYYDAPATSITGERDALIVSDRLISPNLYQALLAGIESQTQLSDYHKDLLGVIFALLYRTGMRISELLGIRVTDIECPNDNIDYCAIIVRPNRYRDLKSDDGARRLVLSTLLKPAECQAFLTLWITKKRQNATYLFTPKNHHEPLSMNAVHYVLGVLLGDTYRDITPHSFRHHAISVLSLIVCTKDNDVLCGFTDYTKDELAKVRIHLLGKQNAINPNHWQSIKAFAGHASIDTTFASYIHTTDLIAASQRASADITLPVALVAKFTGKHNARFNSYAKGTADFGQGVVHLAKIRSMLIKALKPTVLKPVKSDDLTPAHINKHQIKNDNKNHGVKDNLAKTPQATRLLISYPYYQVDKLLQSIENGMTPTDASYPNFLFDDALFIYNNAITLTDKGGKNAYKLIGKERQPKSTHPLIAPTPLHYHQEQALIRLCFDNIKKILQNEKGFENLTRFVDLFDQKVSSNKSQIYFSFKNKDDFEFYYKIALQILPSEYFRINICCVELVKQDNLNDKPKYHKVTNTPKTQKLKTAFLKRHKDFKGQITDKADYNGYHISVIRPNDKGRPTKNQSTSAIMKYVVHVLLVCGFGRR